MGDCHECRCHVNPPCGACENCKHWDVDDCPNDCQLCEYDHWRTGPYRLADGTWSDGVDRSKPIDLRQTTDRYEVTTRNGRGMVWLRATTPEPFDTWAEAIAYADNLARTTKNGENNE